MELLVAVVPQSLLLVAQKAHLALNLLPVAQSLVLVVVPVLVAQSPAALVAVVHLNLHHPLHHPLPLRNLVLNLLNPRLVAVALAALVNLHLVLVNHHLVPVALAALANHHLALVNHPLLLSPVVLLANLARLVQALAVEDRRMS
jgi:hypothetical protein